MTRVLVYIYREREPESHENEYLAEKISKQNVEGAVWIFLTTYRKILEERDKLKKLLCKKPEDKIWTILTLFILQKRRKYIWRRISRVYISLEKEIMGLSEQKHCHFEMKGMEI